MEHFGIESWQVDYLIEAICILAFLRNLEAHIVSAGNIQTCTYHAINHHKQAPTGFHFEASKCFVVS